MPTRRQFSLGLVALAGMLGFTARRPSAAPRSRLDDFVVCCDQRLNVEPLPHLTLTPTVKLPPITSDYELFAALDRARDLISCEPDDPRYAELDALATVIEAYELEYYPIPPPMSQKLQNL